MTDFADEYLRLAHAIQSGVAYSTDPAVKDPKHLRTGIDLRAVEHGALVQLLIDKGVIELGEYHDALLKAMREEIARVEAELTRQYGGAKVTLG